MNIMLERVTPDDDRLTTQLDPGEIVEHEIEVSINGLKRTFVVYLKANVLPGLDAGLLYGDSLLEELMRFEPEGLGKLYRVVGQVRRGATPTLPSLLVEAVSSNKSGHAGLPSY